MYIIGVDYHPSFQQIAFLDQETGECGDRRLNNSDGEAVKVLPGVSVRVGLEATGYSRWFERLLVELGIEVSIGNTAEIKAERVRKPPGQIAPDRCEKHTVNLLSICLGNTKRTGHGENHNQSKENFRDSLHRFKQAFARLD